MAFLSPLARYVLCVVPLLLAFFCMSLGGQTVSAHEGGNTYRVVYVAPDDVLNMRSGPSVGYPIVGRIPHISGGELDPQVSARLLANAVIGLAVEHQHHPVLGMVPAPQRNGRGQPHSRRRGVVPPPPDRRPHHVVSID